MRYNRCHRPSAGVGLAVAKFLSEISYQPDRTKHSVVSNESPEQRSRQSSGRRVGHIFRTARPVVDVSRVADSSPLPTATWEMVELHSRIQARGGAKLIASCQSSSLDILWGRDRSCLKAHCHEGRLAHINQLILKPFLRWATRARTEDLSSHPPSVNLFERTLW